MRNSGKRGGGAVDPSDQQAQYLLMVGRDEDGWRNQTWGGAGRDEVGETRPGLGG